MSCWKLRLSFKFSSPFYVCKKFNQILFLSLQGPPPQGPIKFTIADTLERIKEEFNFLQAQYHS